MYCGVEAGTVHTVASVVGVVGVVRLVVANVVGRGVDLTVGGQVHTVLAENYSE